MPTQLQRIINVQFSNQAADNLGNPYGPITGWAVNPSTSQQWTLVQIPGSNKVNIQNATTGTYASIYKDIDGGSVVGSAEAYPWVLVPTTQGDVYQVATERRGYVWSLDNNGNNYPILIKDPNSNKGQNAQWTLSKV